MFSFPETINLLSNQDKLGQVPIKNKTSRKSIHAKKLWKQFVSSRQNIKMHNLKPLTHLKQSPMLASLKYPDYKTFKNFHPPKPYHLAPCAQSTKPSLTTYNHPNQPPTTHPKYCPLPHPAPTKSNNYQCTRTCACDRRITLVLLGSNIQTFYLTQII